MERLKFYQLQIGETIYYIPEVFIAQKAGADGEGLVVDKDNSKAGFMSVDDYLKLQSIETGAQANIFNKILYRKVVESDGVNKAIDIQIPFDVKKELIFTEGSSFGTIAINGVDVPANGLKELFSVLTEDGKDVNKSIRAIAKDVFYGLIEGVSDETLDTIKEIADFLVEHPEIADITGIKKDIAYFYKMFEYVDVNANCTTVGYHAESGTLILSGVNFDNRGGVDTLPDEGTSPLDKIQVIAPTVRPSEYTGPTETVQPVKPSKVETPSENTEEASN